MRRMASNIVLGLIVLLITSLSAWAQQRQPDVSDLRTGDRVWVVDQAWTEYEARVLSVADSTLRLEIDGKAIDWNLNEAREIWRAGDSLKNGSLIGLAVGSAIGGVGGAAFASLLSNEGHDGLTGFLFLLGVGAGSGVAIGAGFDALIHGRTLVYHQPSRITMMPVITPQTKAVQFRIGF